MTYRLVSLTTHLKVPDRLYGTQAPSKGDVVLAGGERAVVQRVLYDYGDGTQEPESLVFVDLEEDDEV